MRGEVFSVENGSFGTNCYLLLSGTDAAAVDCGCFDPAYAAFLSSHGVTRLRYILLTHGHFDHILGVAGLKEAFGGEIVVSDGDKRCLEREDFSLNAWARYGVQTPVHWDVVVSDGEYLPFGDGEIEVISTPGHTRGGLCYRFGDALFTGDTLFSLSAGRTDFPGGDVRALLSSLQKLAALPGDPVVYPGHGEQSTLSRERRRNPYMKG